MYKVLKLQQTTFACPCQWVGETDDGKRVYIRYRHGGLRVDIDGETVYMDYLGREVDGQMTTRNMRIHTSGVLLFLFDSN